MALELAVLLAAVLGLAWGLAADRIASRWPEHEDGSTRAVDWRTAVVAFVGAGTGAVLVDRFQADIPSLLFLAPVVGVLVLLFAIDLDQRLLPDVLTYPLAASALVGFVTALGPFVRTPSELLWATIAAVGIPALMYALSIPFGAAAIGFGDLKLLVGMGLLVGASRLLSAVIVGIVSAAVVILALMLARRITLKSYVPYGPFLILGAIWSILGTPAA